MTGTLVIDTTAGSVTSGTLTVHGDTNLFTGFFGATYFYNGGFNEFGFLDTGTLVGYTGGTLASDSYVALTTPLGSGPAEVQYLLSGTISGAPLMIETSTLPPAVVGIPYNQQLMAMYGTPPYTWTITSGRLPAGLSFNGATGQISGTPVDTSSSVLTFKVTDSSSPQQSASVTIIVNVIANTLVITTTSLPNGEVGVPYSQTIQTVGGTPPFTFALNPGNTLPPGLTLNSATGTISGNPTTAVTNHRFGVSVTDSSNPIPQTAFTSYSLTITP